MLKRNLWVLVAILFVSAPVGAQVMLCGDSPAFASMKFGIVFPFLKIFGFKEHIW